MSSTPAAKTTTDHKEIRKWAEAHGGKPARVKATGRGSDPGILRIDFPGFSGEGTLETIPWREWFDAFEENNLAFLYQDNPRSRFSKLVSRENVSAPARRAGGAKRTAAKRTTRASGSTSKRAAAKRPAAKRKRVTKRTSVKRTTAKRGSSEATGAARRGGTAKRTTARRGGGTAKRGSSTKKAASSGGRARSSGTGRRSSSKR
jgi:hypothetical protein